MKQPAAGKPRSAATTAPTTHRSLERGLAVLEWLATAPQPVPLADVARGLGLHRSTAYHLLQSLASAGYVAQEEATRAYALTQKLWQISGRGVPPERIGELAHPFLEALTRETGEGSSVAVWHHGQVRIVAKRDADGPVRVVQDVAAQRPLYCTAVGKALAAWMTPQALDAVLDGVTFERRTAKTIVGREALLAELRRIRNAGYAIDDEEQYEGLRCVAMPVSGAEGETLATVCVVGPKHRMTHQKMVAVRGPLSVASRGLSRQLGHGIALKHPGEAA
jgi:DNA-binding IclR family transcriptional regulator